ncbi:uncharacterized protein LOC132546194 [Ylistrum balloti]|uniref:uncharacterized protein LOC132546194 n=1 Tax=Ylistrum balloti TaxID=509963 RepID=UPI002905A33E|nr:uncharacterized protein LOC132546194 [Ylistrum balloti]
MSKQAEEDYRALELYLIQAEEEIGLTLSGTFSPQDFSLQSPEDPHGNNNNDVCNSDLTGSSSSHDSHLDIESNSTSISYPNKGEITDVNKLDLPGQTVDSGYSSQHSNDLENDLNITNTTSPIGYQYQGEITLDSKHDLTELAVDSSPLSGLAEQARSVDKHRNKTRAGDYHTNKTSLDGYHYIPEISDVDNYCFGDKDLVCSSVEFGDNQDFGTPSRRGGSLHDNNWNLKELTAAIAEEIRVPEADRKQQNGDTKTDSEKLKVILGEWNDASNDSSSLEEDSEPVAKCNLEDSVSLLSDVSSDAVSLETSEFDEKSPCVERLRSQSANECQTGVDLHNKKSTANSQEDQNLSEDVNVLSEEKFTQKCESEITVIDENIPNKKSTETSSKSTSCITETSKEEFSDFSKIKNDLTSNIVKPLEESVCLISQPCTAIEDSIGNDSKPPDCKASVEHSTVDPVYSPSLQCNNSTGDSVHSPCLENNNSIVDSGCFTGPEYNNSNINSMCSSGPENNNSTLDSVCLSALENRNSTEDSECLPRLQNSNSIVDSVCLPEQQISDPTTDVSCSLNIQNSSTVDRVYSLSQQNTSSSLDPVCSTLDPVCSTVDPVCPLGLENNNPDEDLDDSLLDKTLMNIPVGDEFRVESVDLPVVRHRDEVKDSVTIQDIRQIPNTALVDYSKTRPGFIADSVLSPVEEDSSIPELCSPDVDASGKNVNDTSHLADYTNIIPSDGRDFCKSDSHIDRKIYDEIHVEEVSQSPSHTSSSDQTEGDIGRCSTPTSFPSVDRTEQIISLTLNQHRILRRSKTLPNFSPSKKQKLNSSVAVDDHQNTSYKGGNYVFRDSYLHGSTSSSPGGLLVTDIDDPTPVFKVQKQTLSTTAVQTSFDDGSNPSSPKHAGNLSQSQQISIGTNTTDSLERPKTRAKRLERLQQKEVSNTATTEIFFDSSKVQVAPACNVSALPANHIAAVPKHMPVKNMTTISQSHVTSVPASHVADDNVTPTNHVTGMSINHVTVTPFTHVTKVSSSNHVPVIPSSHATVNQTSVHDKTKHVSHFTPKPKLPTMEPATSLSVISPVKSPVPKPSNFPENFQPKSQLGYMIHDESPEMQVVVNATSPVLLRRKPSSSRNKQRDIARKELEMYANDTEYSEVNKKSKFMDKDMSKTWDGVSRKKWKQYYAPIMQSMLQNDATTDENCNVKFGSQSLQQKTLLDQMHKKYCAYQYEKGLDIPCLVPQTLTLKPSPPPPDRMRSRSWLLKNYAITLPDTSGSSKVNSTTSPKTDSTKSGSVPGSPTLPPSRDGTLKRQKSDDHQTYSTDSSRDTTPTAQLSPTTPESDGDLKLQPGKGDAEIEAVQACRWLKEAGFPQYAQMYDDGHFPVNIASVEKEHDFLEKDSLQPLVRRLNTLNKCAIMRVSTPTTKKGGEDSDDEDQCALSDKWKYQYNIRRWSRKDFNSPTSEDQNTLVKSSSSNDSLLTDQNSNSETDNSPVLDTKVYHTKGQTNDDYFGVKTSTPINNKDSMSSSVTSPSLRRAASERIKGAKNFLKRVESLKNNRKTKRIGNKNGTAVEISEPVIMDSANMKEKIKHLNCKDLSPSSENGPSSPESGLDRETAMMNSGDVTPTSPEPWSDETTNYKVPNANVKTPSGSLSLQELSDIESVLQTTSTFSTSSMDSDEPLLGSSPRKHFSVRRNHSENNLTDGNNYELPLNRPGRFPKELSSSYSGHGVKHRTGSCNLGRDKLSSSDSCTPVVRRRGSADPRLAGHRTSYYDNVKEEEDLQSTQKELDLILHRLFQDINGLNKAIYGEDAADVELPPSLQTSLNLTSLDLEDSQVNSGINSSDFDPDNDVTSGTVSSPESSDHDIPCEDMSHDDSTEQVIYRERRDSGVGSSLTRTPSDRRRYRIRWHSFQKSHRPSYGNENIQLTCLSICQLMVLQKLSLIKLTALIEKYSPNRPGWNWTVPRFMKRHKVPDYKDKVVFGVPLLVTLQRTGQPLPQCILHAMRYLRKTSPEAVGIFRKPGVRSRIQKLKNELEANPEMVCFEDVQDYDVADLLKQYFRDLPECLLTNKLSEIFINIFIYLPTDQRVEALQSSVLLLPDENREVLESLLLFLSDISQHASEHQMTASNLAVCLAPSLFMVGGSKIGSQSPSPRRPRKNLGVPDTRELMEQKAAHECLTTMIVECKKIFTLSTSTLNKCRFSYIEQGNPVTMEEYTMRSTEDTPGYQSDVETCIQGLQKESHDKFRGWVSTSCSHSIDVSYKKVADGHPLRLWKFQVDVEAPPDVVLDKLKNERQQWDEDLLKWRCIEQLDQQTDVFQYSRNSMPPHPSRDFVVLRSWRTDLPKGACCLVSFSVEHPKAELLGGVRSVELASHFLMEPCGTGKSRITHITRVDLRGRTSEWYKRSFGYITCGMLERIKDSFKQTFEGPDRESTV